MIPRTRAGLIQYRPAGPGSRVALIGLGLPAEAEIDRHQHQSGAMGDGHGKGPKPQLRRWYSREAPRMRAIDKTIDTERNHKKARAELYLALPFDQRDQ